MKILFIAHDTMRVGSGRCLYEFLSLLKPEDGIVPIVLTRNNNDLKQAFVKLGIETYTCRFGATLVNEKNSKFFWGWIYRPITNLIAYLYLKLRLNLKQVDLLYSNSKIIDFGAYLHKKTGIPLIWHLREFGDCDFGLLSFEKNLSKYIDENSTAIITVSKAIKKHFEDNGGSVDKAVCVYDGVLGNSFKIKKLKRNDELVRICMCGCLCHAKGQLIALNAVSMLPKNLKEKIHLDFYGCGYLENEMKSFIDQHKLQSIVSLKGFCSNLPEILCSYDVGLNLSTSEGFGRTTVEYMLSELFVIGSNSGATPELLDYGRVGALVDYGDAKSVADILTDVINGKEKYIKIGQDAADFARKHFCVENNYKNIVQFIKNSVE